MQKFKLTNNQKKLVSGLFIVGGLMVVGYFLHLPIIDWIYNKYGFNVTSDIATIFYLLVGGILFKLICKKMNIKF